MRKAFIPTTMTSSAMELGGGQRKLQVTQSSTYMAMNDMKSMDVTNSSG